MPLVSTTNSAPIILLLHVPVVLVDHPDAASTPDQNAKSAVDTVDEEPMPPPDVRISTEAAPDSSEGPRSADLDASVIDRLIAEDERNESGSIEEQSNETVEKLAAQAAETDESDGDEETSDPKRALNEKECRNLVRAFERYGYVEDKQASKTHVVSLNP